MSVRWGWGNAACGVTAGLERCSRAGDGGMLPSKRRVGFTRRSIAPSRSVRATSRALKWAVASERQDDVASRHKRSASDT